MIKCAACDAPLLTATIANTDISVRVTCSCGNVSDIANGVAVLARSYRHPDFVVGNDEERYHTLRLGILELERIHKGNADLLQAMRREKNRLWKTVQLTYVRRHEVKDAVEVLGREKTAAKLMEMFTPEQLAEMMEAMK